MLHQQGSTYSNFNEVRTAIIFCRLVDIPAINASRKTKIQHIMVSQKQIILLRKLQGVIQADQKIKLLTDMGEFVGTIVSYTDGPAAELELDPETGEGWDSPDIPLIFRFKVDSTERVIEIGFRQIMEFTVVK